MLLKIYVTLSVFILQINKVKLTKSATSPSFTEAGDIQLTHFARLIARYPAKRLEGMKDNSGNRNLENL